MYFKCFLFIGYSFQYLCEKGEAFVWGGEDFWGVREG